MGEAYQTPWKSARTESLSPRRDLFPGGSAGGKVHRQGNIGRSVVAVQQKPYGGLRDFGYRLDDGGADVP